VGSGKLYSVAPVKISTYDPQWPERASVLIAQLHDVLGRDALRIEHIGSTAIPQMDAKDILDVQVSVADLNAAAERFDQPLVTMGFQRLPYDCDHVPAGSPDGPALWAKRFWRRRSQLDGDVNLHVRPVGSQNERLALLFRDWMRAHPEAVPPYAAFKRALAAAAPDVDWYSDLKDPVVDLVVAMAESWSRRTGWTLAASSA
jgi:dephospho-CoA kinase